MLLKATAASCLIMSLKTHNLINIILEYSGDVADDDTKEEEMIEELIMLNVSSMSCAEETRLVNKWQKQIRNNFAKPIDKTTEFVDWVNESIDEIWEETINQDANDQIWQEAGSQDGK